MNIFSKFHKDRRKIVDFLLIPKFWARELFLGHPLFKFFDIISRYLDKTNPKLFATYIINELEHITDGPNAGIPGHLGMSSIFIQVPN